MHLLDDIYHQLNVSQLLICIENNEYSFVNNPKYMEKSSPGWGSNPHLLQSGKMSQPFGPPTVPASPCINSSLRALLVRSSGTLTLNALQSAVIYIQCICTYVQCICSVHMLDGNYHQLNVSQLLICIENNETKWLGCLPRLQEVCV